jgi:hypothetical protein
MKKTISIFGLLMLSCVFSITANAQAFQKGTKNLSIGVGSGYGLGLNAGVDIGISDLVSVGAIGAFSSRNYGYLTNDYRVTYVGIGGRAGVHFGKYLKDLGIDEDKFDPYVGLTAGFRTVKVGGTYSQYYSGVNGGIFFGGYGGVRYYFKEKLGIYAEGGFPYSSLGLTIKF